MYFKNFIFLLSLQLTVLPTASGSLLSECFARLVKNKSESFSDLRGASGKNYETVPMLEKFKALDKERDVKYLSEVDRRKKEVFVNEKGQLVHANGKLLLKEDLIFVMDGEGRIYVGTGVNFEFHHSSFLSGEPVAAAGRLQTNSGGFVEDITGESGHYKPKADELLQIIAELKQRGANLMPWAEVVKQRKKNKLPVFFTH